MKSLLLSTFTLLLFSLSTCTKPISTDCLTPEIRETLIGTISNWYYAQIDGVKFSFTIDEFNKNIDDVFKCNCKDKLDICIGSSVDDCSIGRYTTCKQLKSKTNGYWQQFKDTLIGITFGQIDFECDKQTGNIIARLTKSIYFQEIGARFNDDLWVFDPDDLRAIAWIVYAATI